MLRLLVFIACFSALVAGLQFFLPAIIHGSVWQITSFMAILSLFAHFFMAFVLRKNKELFLLAYFTNMIIRLLACVGFVFVMVFSGLENRIVFMANFFAAYLFFLGFEIYLLLANLRANSKAVNQ
ncbi:MAG: hypothetical protein H7Y04_00970 [Verrucomicrobia bacterium]|nr:hypothetical protein [Cytophagales bacterium]